MITKAGAYRTQDGRYFGTMEEAINHEEKIKFSARFEIFMSQNFPLYGNSQQEIKAVIKDNLKEIADLFHLFNASEDSSASNDKLEHFFNVRFNENASYKLKDIKRVVIKDYLELCDILTDHQNQD